MNISINTRAQTCHIFVIWQICIDEVAVYICNLVRERAKHGYLNTCKVRQEDCEFKANLYCIEDLNPPSDIVKLSSSGTNPWQLRSSFGYKVLRGGRLQCWMCPW